MCRTLFTTIYVYGDVYDFQHKFNVLYADCVQFMYSIEMKPKLLSNLIRPQTVS